ncbi:amidohydrolase 2 [Burkholderia stabilis]|uniref:amidohydrolase family protein n=2 Tax=Burkholderia stabilis TaxID=95485 RepID=UPI0008518657|nr:amidohydrolase family protein [Burkholderia stabilis]AOR66681.1 amidohydrolase 2 [Burkholderia stabilis]HDR9496361.1 amidohydrolase [Burkholderia stabilis]HDR9528062.1 amidohydrolase [Burkholderia stabilis]HDR9532863.1 amidohydrolase [Burkholderia stabilis]HDR9542926.1 amidohydrolase [Burkholderia stabilis]
MQPRNWIDVHAHFTPPMTTAESDARWNAMQNYDWIGAKPPDWSVESALDVMDRLGIRMQMLSNIPFAPDMLRKSNEYGASIVERYPSRFGLLAALPTDDPDAALAEIERAATMLQADGFAMTCCYNGVYLSDTRLEPVWAELNRRKAVVFVHPNAYGPGMFGRASALLEVAFETTRTVVDMLYAGIFRRYPDVRLILAHCGAALPALSERLVLIGTQPWVRNPSMLTESEMRNQLARLYVDTAMTGSVHTIAPAVAMTGIDHIVYGSDCGVPCTCFDTMESNMRTLRLSSGLDSRQLSQLGRNALKLFPMASGRICRAPSK